MQKQINTGDEEYDHEIKALLDKPGKTNLDYVKINMALSGEIYKPPEDEPLEEPKAPPSMDWTRQEICRFLDENQIEYESSWNKHELLNAIDL